MKICEMQLKKYNYKFITLNAYHIREEKESQINYLTFILLEKKSKWNPKQAEERDNNEHKSIKLNIEK